MTNNACKCYLLLTYFFTFAYGWAVVSGSHENGLPGGLWNVSNYVNPIPIYTRTRDFYLDVYYQLSNSTAGSSDTKREANTNDTCLTQNSTIDGRSTYAIYCLLPDGSMYVEYQTPISVDSEKYTEHFSNITLFSNFKYLPFQYYYRKTQTIAALPANIVTMLDWAIKDVVSSGSTKPDSNKIFEQYETNSLYLDVNSTWSWSAFITSYTTGKKHDKTANLAKIRDAIKTTLLSDIQQGKSAFCITVNNGATWRLEARFMNGYSAAPFQPGGGWTIPCIENDNVLKRRLPGRNWPGMTGYYAL
ncbi:hypothetical protein C6P41_001413 [Kluyveromyces marxianus]|nr:hypothetical protein C6P41_001413 [Kluyveromyces marxianus]